MGSKIRIPLFIMLARALQAVYGLSHRQFFLVLAVGLVLMIIINGLTHSDQVPAGEAAEKGAHKMKKAAKQLKDLTAGHKHQNYTGKVLLVDAVHTFVDEKGQVDKKLFDLLETYPFRKIIVTNATTEKMKTYGLDDMPYDVFTLQHTPKKIDPTYFLALIEEFSLEKEHLVYFEHNIKAVVSAQSIGITSYHYDTETKDLQKLESFLNTHLY